MKLPPYPKYKSSGVEWLGDVPAHWGVKRLKFVLPPLQSGVSVNAEKTPTDDDYPGVLKTSCVYGNRFRPDQNKRVVEADLDRLSCPVTADSVIISRMNTPELVGSCGYVEREYRNLFLPDRLWIARFSAASRVTAKYAWYLLISHAMGDLTGALATGTSGSMKNISQEAFLGIAATVPPRREQRAIVDFLDRETAKIDALGTKKRTLIERLKEKRTAVISRTVTRGLPPDAARAAGLEPHPKLKPSGVEWLGDVPEHWGIARLSHRFRNLDHRRIPVSREDRSNLEKTYPYYGASGIIDYVDEYLFDETLILVAEDGANLLSRSTPLAFLASGRYWVNNHAHILKPIDGDIRYWVGVLQTYDYTPLVTGAAQPKLTSERLGSVPVPHPPRGEQGAIADFLDREMARIDGMVVKVETAVERLQEYRAALITAAVTGEVDVRAAVA